MLICSRSDQTTPDPSYSGGEKIPVIIRNIHNMNYVVCIIINYGNYGLLWEFVSKIFSVYLTYGRYFSRSVVFIFRIFDVNDYISWDYSSYIYNQEKRNNK